MVQPLNEDILHHIVPYLSPQTLDRINATNYVFFDKWMKSRYESLSFVKNDRETKRLLAHLTDPNVAVYVKKILLRPWPVKPPEMTHKKLNQSLWMNINEIFDPDCIKTATERRLQHFLRQDVALVVSAFNAMQNIEEYAIYWDEDNGPYPELYQPFFAPTLRNWRGQLVKLTIKVPPQFLKSLASVRLLNLETLEYHFCTGQIPSMGIDDIHNGFLVFVNNLKDSLKSLSFISTYTSLNLDICRIYKLLGPFPRLHSISLSIPFDGGHLSDPLIFVQFLEKHRSTLDSLSLLTSRCTVHSMPTHPECINWIQKILTSIQSPFPLLRSLALALRPLRAPLTNVSNFMEMHMSTLNSLSLVDRALSFHEFVSLIETASGRYDVTGLRHLRIKLDTFCPNVLYYLACRMPELTTLDVECSAIMGRHHYGEIIANKNILVHWKLQRIAIGPEDWRGDMKYALVECMPNVMITPFVMV